MIFSLKTKVIGGRGCLEQLGETVEGFGVKKALLCTDAFLAGTPAASRIVEMLERRGIRCPVYTRLQPEPIDVHCDEGAPFCAENGVELIVALGGGSVMDQSKAMAAIVTNGLPVRQLEDRPIPKRMLPLVCVPTTAGTGSEVTFVSVITNTDEQRKMTIMDADSLSPDVAICDPELLTTLPRGLIASCGVDALTHAIESFTSLPANPISDALALRAMELIAANLPRCWQDPSDLQAQGSMMLASTMAGAAFINADVGAVHALAETVGAFFHIPHGVANSLFLPYIMEFSRVGNAALYARVARQLGAAGPGTDDETAARGAVAFVEGLVRRLEIPAFASFKNVDPARFEELARCGCFQGAGLYEDWADHDSLRSFAEVFADEDFMKYFDMEIVEATDSQLKLRFHHCPLVAGWQAIGCSDEEVARLCDIAMDGDRNIAAACKLDFTLGDTLARGGKCCELCFRLPRE